MRIKKRVYHLIIFFSLTVFWSCKKYLEKPPDDLVAYPTTLANLQAIMDNPQSVNEGLTPSYEEASADDYFVFESTYNGFDQINRQAYIWDVPTFNSTNDWRIAYGPVYIANTCIEQIDKIPQTS